MYVFSCVYIHMSTNSKVFHLYVYVGCGVSSLSVIVESLEGVGRSHPLPCDKAGLPIYD